MSARAAIVPVSTGSRAARTIEAGPFRVTRAEFPAGQWIPPHSHDRACVAVMLRGSFDLRFSGKREIDCRPGTISVEPVGDTHCNCVGNAGADVLVVQPDPAETEALTPLLRFLDGIREARGADLESIAYRMGCELARPDALSPLILEGLALELLGTAARRGGFDSAPPPCVRRAEEILRARFRTPPSVSALASECGAHPSHLAHAFRLHLRTSIGGFVRQLRVQWAADRLRASCDPIAQVAVDAGFADQSHFTRRFHDQLGMTPGRWRREHRSH